MAGDRGEKPFGEAVARNFTYLLAAQVAAGLAGLASMAYLARILGPETFGILGFGTAVVAYFGHLAVLGSDSYGAREIARDPGSAATLVTRIVGLRMLTVVTASILFLLVVWVIDQPATVKIVMIVQGVGLIVTLVALDFVFQGLQRMELIAARQFAASLLVLIAVLVLIDGRDDIYVAAGIPVAATAVTAIWLVSRIRKSVGPVGFRADPAESKTLLRVVLPFAVSGAMSTIYYNTDIVMLGFLSDHQAVGLYVGAYRLFLVSLMVGNLICAAYAPALAAAWRDEASRRAGFRDFTGAMFFVGMPIAAAGIAFPREIVAIMFGAEFDAAHDAFVILMVAVALAHVAITGGTCLIAWSDQTAHMIILACGAVANVIANVVLIPRFGIMGAAAATLVCQGVVAIVILARVHRRFVAVETMRLVRPVMCAAAAFTAARLVFELLGAVRPDGSGGFGLVGCAALGGALYVGLAVIFGAVDLARLRSAIRDRSARGGG